MKSQNPLRISQESIDLGDIISDLNEGNQSTAQFSQVKSTTQDSVQKPQHKSKPGLLAQKQPSRSRLATQASNKENQNKANSIAGKAAFNSHAQDSKKDFLVSTLSGESQTTIEVRSNTQNDEVKSNTRYSQQQDSNFKFDAFTSQAQTDDQDSSVVQSNNLAIHQESQPFYLNRVIANHGSSITDEDVEGFQKKLDTLILNFRSETMTEFMRTKKQVLQDQAQTIDAERRRCNTMLGVKQNEIEQLKENLSMKTKMCDELGIRSEILAIWAGKGKTLARMKVLQFKCFSTLKNFKEFQKHSKQMLTHKSQENKLSMKRRVFLAWEKQYKEWKIEKNRRDFEKKVKEELQHISAQYSKEIESLRQKLEEANIIVDQENRNKAMMQENLKKAFMRGVCALNFEAMNILSPNDANYQNQIEREMEKQVMFAMNGIANSNSINTPQQNNSNQERPLSPSRMPSRTFTNNSEFLSYSQSDNNDNYTSERKIMQIDQNREMEYKKVETKDSLWKPAPIMGREIIQPTVVQQNFNFSQPQITSALRTTQQFQNFVLPSHFSKVNESQNIIQQTGFNQGFEPQRLEQSTEDRTIHVQQPIVTNNFQSSLPDFVSSSLPQISNTSSTQGEGKTIYASQTSMKTQVKGTSNGTSNLAKKSSITSSTTGLKKNK